MCHERVYALAIRSRARDNAPPLPEPWERDEKAAEGCRDYVDISGFVNGRDLCLFRLSWEV